MINEELDSMIEKSFRSEPDFQLPVDFAQRVTFTVVRRALWKNDLNEYLSLTALILILISAVAGLYYYIDKEFMMKFYYVITGNVVHVISGVFLLNFILFADRVLLRLLFSRWNRT